MDPDPCAFQSSGPPFNVGIQNRNGTTGVVPYDTAACMERTSTTFFPDGIVPVDIFSRRDHLDTDFGSSLPPVPVGTQFQFNVIPSVNSGLPPQTVITTLRNAEADPATDFISIPNPAPGLSTMKPTGFTLADAKLGQNLTVSWTLPTSFEIGNVMLTGNVTASESSGQSAGQSAPGQSPPAFTLPPLSCTPSSIDLPVTTTSATFKFPTSCFGMPVTQAQFCIFVTGTAATQGKTTAACWFFQDPN